MASSMKNRRRAAFTLVELLVVIAIIGVLVALLLPAVQMARESARRTQCNNNLRQVQLGLHGFVDSYGALPPGALTNTTGVAASKLNLRTGATHGWGIFIYPYIEQKNLADFYKWDKHWYAAENKQVRESFVSVFICPSTPKPKRLDNSSTSGVSWSAAASDYGVCNGSNAAALNPLGLLAKETNLKPNGAMRTNEMQKFSDVTDGLTNTFWIGEAAGRPQLYRSKSLRVGTSRAAGSSMLDPANEFIMHGFNSTGTANPGACPMNCTNGDELYSFHPGGINVAMGDGSIRYLAQNMPMKLVAALISRGAKDSVE
jgi:prepilin-type N-terminal cleavage/methylation domain-containing protein/prepilin-type processing-associated H-X9-DG protein